MRIVLMLNIKDLMLLLLIFITLLIIMYKLIKHKVSKIKYNTKENKSQRFAKKEKR